MKQKDYLVDDETNGVPDHLLFNYSKIKADCDNLGSFGH